MHCRNCGAEVKPNATFCKSCGAPVKSQSSLKNSAIPAGSIKQSQPITSNYQPIKNTMHLNGYGIKHSSGLRTPSGVRPGTRVVLPDHPTFTTPSGNNGGKKGGQGKAVAIAIVIILLIVGIGLGIAFGMGAFNHGDKGNAANNTEQVSSNNNDNGNDNSGSDNGGSISKNGPDGEFTYEDVKSDTYYYEETPAENLVTDSSTNTTYANNELILFVESGTSKSSVEGLVSPKGGSIIGYLEGTSCYQIRFNKTYSYSELKSLASELEKSSFVTRASVNVSVQSETSATTSDPAWSDTKKVWGYKAINLESAWSQQTGSSNITVGIWDNMFYTRHEDLSFSATLNNYYSTQSDGFYHGTHVAGTIAAKSNSSGSVGVAYGCRIVGTTFNDSTMSDVAKLEWLVKEEGARVVSCSWGPNPSTGYAASCGNTDAQNAIQTKADNIESAINDLTSKGYDFVLCGSAGNDNGYEFYKIYEPVTINGTTYEYGYMKKSDEVDEYLKNLATNDKTKFKSLTGKTSFSSLSTESGKSIASWSYWGAIDDENAKKHVVVVGAAEQSNNSYKVASYSKGGDRVDLISPGTDIYSSVGTTSNTSDYEYLSGTSMATPMVSGVAALMYSANPNLTGDQVKSTLKNTATGSYKDTVTSTTYGMLDAATAVKSAKTKAESSTKDGDGKSRDIVLVLDVSGSMDGDPKEQLQQACQQFLDEVSPYGARVGIVAFDGNATELCELTDDYDIASAAVTKIANTGGGGTNMEAGLKVAEEWLSTSKADKKIMVVMSDGQPNSGKQGDSLISYADSISDNDIHIYTLGFFSALSGSTKASAQTLLEGVASNKESHYEVDNADDLKFFFGDLADEITGTKYTYVRIACPVNVTVTYNGQTLNSTDRTTSQRTDFGTLTFESVSDGNGGTDVVKILRLKEGPSYEIQINGYADGTMDYSIGFVDNNGNYSDTRQFNDIAVNANTVVKTVAEVKDETIVQIDEDGDGVFEKTLSAGANGIGKLVDNSWLGGLVALLFFIVLIVVILIVWRVKRKQGGHCRYCGAKLSRNARVCPACGASTITPPVTGNTGYAMAGGYGNTGSTGYYPPQTGFNAGVQRTTQGTWNSGAMGRQSGWTQTGTWGQTGNWGQAGPTQNGWSQAGVTQAAWNQSRTTQSGWGQGNTGQGYWPQNTATQQAWTQSAVAQNYSQYGQSFFTNPTTTLRPTGAFSPDDPIVTWNAPTTEQPDLSYGQAGRQPHPRPYPYSQGRYTNR